MSILSINKLNGFANSTVNRIVRMIPAAEFKSNGRATNSLKWIGQHLSSPQNRLILGVTALMTQPFIDLHNRHVDEKTKKVSTARTIAKIIAGTTTGVIIRYLCILAANKFTKHPSKALKSIYSAFYPKGIKNVSAKGLKKYIDALGTISSLFIFTFTNFLIDAPLTKYLTNKFIKKIDDTESGQKISHIDEFVKNTKKGEINES